MGKRDRDGLRLHFDRRVYLEFHGATFTSYDGLLGWRVIDEPLVLTETAIASLQRIRGGLNGWHQFVHFLDEMGVDNWRKRVGLRSKIDAFFEWARPFT